MNKLSRKGFYIPNWAIIIILLLIFTPLGAMAKMAASGDWSFLSGLTGGNGYVPTPGGVYVGTVTIGVNEVNFDGDAAETLTGSVFTAYHGADGVGQGGKAISASGTSFKLEEADKGIIYMKVYAGTAHYTVWTQIQNYNNEVSNVNWEDVDNDNLDDLIVTLDLSGIRETTVGVTPTWDLLLPVTDEDVSGLTTSAPANQTSKATNTSTFITYHISGLSEKAGFAISKIYFTSNETREGTDIKCTALTLSGFGITNWGKAAPVFVQGGPNAGDYEAWYVRNSDDNDYNKGLMCIRGTNTADDLTITLKLDLFLDASDVLYIDLNIEYVQAEGTSGTITNRVTVSY